VVRVLAALYPWVTAFAVLATGNHFLLDIVGGLLVLALSTLLVGSPERLAGRLSLARTWSALRARRGSAESAERAAK
jgi:membrane-associated phospholipid phosphatase